ncbi:FAD/NAD(P)-binding protein [Kibdelosporangium phytohabitans]|uniref:FAD-binding protein n=1 Tax=Kibdelosporangium phytohabitans TaxID=860235 RepID=A0A0N9I425_9PSEU|nr:FAD/NAD(P)-binding protein [Kibdelosporangium phytohabitans]ALG09312.1 FAD-binding protein [Kibdelosporangium phytohabitans]MBE1469431.1 putative NAD(P)/FAD-binding protein YdhS [Kibdelosporangium phytohabitans]
MALEIGIVGVGPRGLSVLERLCANERGAPSHPAITVHVVDPVATGPGAVWRTDQSRHLLTNTVASQISVYTDDSVTMDGPVEPGPSLYEWASSLALLGSCGDFDEETLAEARTLGPDDYPTRALYGRYLQHAFDRVVANAPAHVTVRVHDSQAVAIADTHGVVGGPQGIRLRNGTRLNHLDAVVLAQGHVPAKLTPREARTASLARIYYLTYLTPANPADVDLSGIDAGETVLLRGLGLNFFDYLALFTAGRGGVFHRDGDRLVYRPSGQEPRLFACSRRGVPYHARGENQKGAFGRYVPRLLTPEMISRLAGQDWVRLDKDLWPVIAKEVESLYYGTWLTAAGRDGERSSFVCQYLAAGPRQQARLLDTFRVPLADRWDWDRIARPYAGTRFTDRAHFRSWLLDYLADDVREAKAGNVSGPLKAALDALRDLRNEIRLVVDHGGLEGQSYRDHLEGWYTPLNAYLSIGPPVSRIEEMIALVEAGVLELTGPGTQIAIDMAEPAFVAESPLVPGPRVRAKVLIEARLPEPDLRRTEDPLLRHMLDTDQCRPFSIRTAAGGEYETGGLAVTRRPNRVIDVQGNVHPRRFAYGVPTEAVHWVTAAGIRPGVDSMTVGDSDAIARAVLALPPVADVPAPAVDENVIV